jgi:hypothetical protein
MQSTAQNQSPLCRDFLLRTCQRGDECKFTHDTKICKHFWKNGSCKFGEHCRKSHVTNSHSRDKKEQGPRRKAKNTECFTPMTKAVDMRIVLDLGRESLSTNLTSRDILLVPNLFSDYEPMEMYNKLVSEIENCNVPKDELLKLWHGNDKIPGTHLIANDRTRWKDHAPTFKLIVERLKKFFNMRVEATRFNWYQDTSHWKPFHHDSAYVDPKKAEIQNFTVAVSFGATRDAAFERADGSKNVIGFPQGDGHVYCFAKETNALYRHGILQDMPTRQQGRISVILWGFVDNISEL